MRIYITDKNETREITLKVWDNKTNGGWSPDIFGDLADTIPGEFPAADYDTDAEAAMSDNDYAETVEWWQTEVDAYNARKRNSWFVEGMSEDEIDAEFARDLEYGLFAD